MEKETDKKTRLKVSLCEHPFSCLIILFGVGYGVFYVIAKYLFIAQGIRVILAGTVLGLLLVFTNLLTWKMITLYFCPRGKTALDALDFLALYKAWGAHILFYTVWFIPIWPALLIVFIWYQGWQHKRNLRLSCTCPKCSEIALKPLSDEETDPLLYETDCLELERGVCVIKYYRCLSCGKLLKHRMTLDKERKWYLYNHPLISLPPGKEL